MQTIECGGCAPPVVAPSVVDRINEHLHGEAFYDTLQLLRDARDEIMRLEFVATGRASTG